MAELTWEETASDNVKSNGQRDKKVAARALTSNGRMKDGLWSDFIRLVL